MEREVAFKALVGSPNYNLHTIDSDRDWKTFVLPTFEDLYHGKQYSKQSVTEQEDNSYHDVRKMTHLFWKANINFLEVLFSSEYEIYNTEAKPMLEFMIENREQVAAMNLPYLFDACIGMHFQKRKTMTKPTSGTEEGFYASGYDRKDALHAYRIADFLVRYAVFGSFEQAIIYTEEEKQYMLDMKHGGIHVDSIDLILDDKLSDAQELKPFYKVKNEPNEALRDELDEKLKDTVRNHLRKELK